MHWNYNDPVCFQLDTAKSFRCISFQLRWNKMSLNTDKSLGQGRLPIENRLSSICFTIVYFLHRAIIGKFSALLLFSQGES